jgi:replication factor C subunit 3/5
MLLIDKYQIKDKEQLIFHHSIYKTIFPINSIIDYENYNEEEFKNNVLLNLNCKSKFKNLPNILVHGPEGSGKQTFIRLLLKEIYGCDVERLTSETYSIVGYGNSPTEIQIVQSHYHMIIEPSNNGFDKYIIQEIINEYAKRQIIQIGDRNVPFKIILINNIDRMSYYAQTSLRCTMERYHQTCKFILCGYQISKILDPIRSRCLNVRIPHPKNEELLELILQISVKENLQISMKTCRTITKQSEGNIKIAIWLLELIKNKNKNIQLSWKTKLSPIIDIIYQYGFQNKPYSIYYHQEIRTILNTILITNISGTDIMSEILQQLVLFQPSYPNDLILQFIDDIARYETILSKGKRNIIHLESLIINIMYKASCYNSQRKIET